MGFLQSTRGKIIAIVVATLLFILLSSVLYVSCHRVQDTGDDELSDGVLNVGVLNGMDRFLYKDGSEYYGIEADLVRRFASSLVGEEGAIEVEFREATDRAGLLRMLDDNTVDLVLGRLVEDDEISQNYLATRYYAKAGLFIVTPKNCYIDNFGSLNGQSVGVFSDIPASLVADVPFISGVTQEAFEDTERMGEAIASGALFAGIAREREALQMVRDNPALQTQEIQNSPRENYVVVMRQGAAELYTQMSVNIFAYLGEMAQEGGYVGTEETEQNGVSVAGREVYYDDGRTLSEDEFSLSRDNDVSTQDETFSMRDEGTGETGTGSPEESASDTSEEDVLADFFSAG